ncbi:MAG TPA: hypothetical protein PLS07_07505 [Niabella sp.]|nr:hypothetical protein [Niabella sp.]HQW14927.1 hypothetical protein [Niabella sp.]HQX20181.1 hypothetical protein [Niabella sp.]HQX42689.1 hypothetical protein [Niabella sp.]HRB06786.1 hypothetical protein [Niabella sp.]
MKVSKLNLIRHISLIIFLTALLALGIAYPFLTGDYDRLAMPISTMIQVFGLVGLSLVPVGILWLTIPKYMFGFAIAAMVVSTIILLIISLFAILSVGKAFGLLTILLWTFILTLVIPKVKQLKGQASKKFVLLPFYLICLPISTLLLQLTLAKPLTQLSRNRAIENAYQFIRHIDEYHTQSGQYPLTLQAQNKDYYPDVVGVEKYLYAPHGKGYNLSFEQPRFLLDHFGTREWVVYNPLDENSVYSHTAWLLPTEQTEPSQ